MVIAPCTITQCCAILDENEISLPFKGDSFSCQRAKKREEKEHFLKIRNLFIRHVFHKHFDLPAGT